MAQGVVQQVAQGRNCQRRRHAQVDLRGLLGQAQYDATVIATAGILHRLAGDLLGAALHAILERQAALDTCQHQQLLKRAVHAVSTLLGMLQRLFTHRAIGHARDLQVGLDRRQRAAQLMGSVIGQAPLALKGLGDALEQLILGFHQRLQFTRYATDLQRLDAVDTTLAQRIADPIDRLQPFAQTDPQQAKAAGISLEDLFTNAIELSFKK